MDMFSDHRRQQAEHMQLVIIKITVDSNRYTHYCQYLFHDYKGNVLSCGSDAQRLSHGYTDRLSSLPRRDRLWPGMRIFMQRL